MDMSCPFVRHRQPPSSIAIVNRHRESSRLLGPIPRMLYGLLRVVRNSTVAGPLASSFSFSSLSLSLLSSPLLSSLLLSRKADDGRLSEEATLLYSTLPYPTLPYPTLPYCMSYPRLGRAVAARACIRNYRGSLIDITVLRSQSVSQSVSHSAVQCCECCSRQARLLYSTATHHRRRRRHHRRHRHRHRQCQWTVYLDLGLDLDLCGSG